MSEFEKTCDSCRFKRYGHNNVVCAFCVDFSRWDTPDWLTEWLSSFNTDSATECFTAVNILKQKLEDAE